MKLVLASSSPFRKKLLQSLSVPFTVCNPDIDETPKPGESPIALVKRLAREKAAAVCEHFSNALVIGSDQVALHGEKIVGKPLNHENAVAQLRAASGKKITLYTGLALINTKSGSVQSDVVPYSVVFKTLNDALIERYLRKDQPYQSAGSVRAERLGIALLEKFEGDDPNALIGLPLIRLVSMLEQEGFDLYADNINTRNN